MLDQILVESAVVMEQVEGVEQESVIVEQKVKQLEVSSTVVYRRILTNARRTAMVVRGFAMASGSAFSEVYILGIEAALMTAELIFDIAAAESLTLVLAFQAAAKFTMVAVLLARANALKQQEQETAMRMQGVITMLTVFTYAVFFNTLFVLYVWDLIK
jgi:hypothetical protein